MSRRHPNHRHVKIHRSYTVEEVSDLFGIHKNTVREWIRGGLSVLDDKRPMLLAGQDISDFLQARRTKNKRRCHPGELYCVRCRAPKFPAGGMSDCVPVNETTSHLTAICPDCYCMMNQRIGMEKLAHLRSVFAVTFPQDPCQVSKSLQPFVNSDLEQEMKR